MKKYLKKKSENISDWYTDVILKSQVADYAPVRGCMIIRPYGYTIWEKIKEYLDAKIKERGVKNAYFPLLIPEHFLKKEKEHVKGFSPETAVVTYAGGEELQEKLIVRPTSETIMYEMYKEWTQSYRELPILINQWNNCVRWEKRTYFFLRTTEFLWQEGHCAHETHEESLNQVLWALNTYVDTYKNLFALYPIYGTKSRKETFAGADRTYTCEILMPDGKALQAGTSHDLGQNFAKAFDWQVQGRDVGKLYPWQNSWGFSTRSMGGLIMSHGDDNGLVLPPALAPTQIVIIPITVTNELQSYVEKVKKNLTNYRVEVDKTEDETVGFKFNKWELKGVPLRIEVGSKEQAENKVILVRRDTGEKLSVEFNELRKRVKEVLENVQQSMLEKHKIFTEENIRTVNDFVEFKKIMESVRGYISAFWCENEGCEEKIKAETKATTRCLPEDTKDEVGKCVYCGKESKHRWLFAQAY